MAEQKELVNPDTGEIVSYTPEGEVKLFEKYDMQAAFEKAGTLKLPEAQQKKLWAQVKGEDVLIRPDGQIYLPWTWYQKRLRDVFGFEWALMPMTDAPKYIETQSVIAWGFVLIVKGCYAAYAIGEHEYKSTSKITYVEGFESAKSNALMRCCKQIGLSTDYLWDRTWIAAWKKQHAVSYKTMVKNKEVTRWKLKKAGSKSTEEKKDENLEPSQRSRNQIRAQDLKDSINAHFAHQCFHGEIDYKNRPTNLDEVKKKYDLSKLSLKELETLQKNIFNMLEIAMERDSDLGELGDGEMFTEESINEKA